MESAQKTEIRSLEVKLTEGERSQRARRAAEVLRQRDQAEADMKLKAKLAKGELDKHEAELRKLAQAAREGCEVQEVECHWVPDYASKKMRLVRDDTGAVVEVRQMSMDEQQTKLDLHS
ncbi:MAG: hypothetical protein EPO40_06195 [Myxococcaceae bacterium]|nr:MAG: hypothetical protein EPO40_06195 [Myxococcaceae bacterium]